MRARTDTTHTYTHSHRTCRRTPHMHIPSFGLLPRTAYSFHPGLASNKVPLPVVFDKKLRDVALDNKIIFPHSLPPGKIIDLPQHALQQEIKRTKMAEN